MKDIIMDHMPGMSEKHVYNSGFEDSVAIEKVYEVQYCCGSNLKMNIIKVKLSICLTN
jgi:hypothetical protein